MYTNMIISYSELLKQRSFLTDLAFGGVKAARLRLVVVNAEIDAKEKNPQIFDPLFVHSKAGYTSQLVKTLVVQALHGSDTCALELQKYADWIIATRALKND